MIYNMNHKFIFVHIPRSGGIAVTDTLLTHFPDSYVDIMHRRHRYAIGCKELDRLGEIWDHMYKFAIMRNPWEIVESDFRLVMRDVATLHSHSKMELYDLWHRRLTRAKQYKSFTEYVAREFLGRDIVWEGGFWKTWCCDREGIDLGLDIIQYDNLEEGWLRVCRRLDMPQNPLPSMNSGNTINFSVKYMSTVLKQLGVKPVKIPKINCQLPFPCIWSPAARDAIGELCCVDIEKFGYEFQGQVSS